MALSIQNKLDAFVIEVASVEGGSVFNGATLSSLLANPYIGQLAAAPWH